MVLEKVLVSVLVNILGNVTHWLILAGARDAYISEKESESEMVQGSSDCGDEGGDSFLPIFVGQL